MKGERRAFLKQSGAAIAAVSLSDTLMPLFADDSNKKLDVDKLNIKLTDEEKDILAGSQGPTMAKIMKSVVVYGEVHGAKRLLPLDAPTHYVTAMAMKGLEAIPRMLSELIKGGVKAKLPFTADPKPYDFENVPYTAEQKAACKELYEHQDFYEDQLLKLGLMDENAFSCTCYLKENKNVPKKGEILGWAESSAVVFANSVIGAKCNRNSGPIELLYGIVGKTPEFDLLIDENRKANWVIELKTKELPPATVLGSAIGMKVVSDIPYIVGLDKFIGNKLDDKTIDYLKDMGAATASNGAVGLYHVENLTPEAVEQGKGIIGKNVKKYVIDDAEIQRVINSYPILWKDKNAKPKLAVVGCPQLSLSQVYEWKDKLVNALKKANKTKIEMDMILCASPNILAKFKEDKKSYDELIATGAKLTHICPAMHMINQKWAVEPVITNSNKLRTYSTSRFYLEDDLLDIVTNAKA